MHRRDNPQHGHPSDPYPRAGGYVLMRKTSRPPAPARAGRHRTQGREREGGTQTPPDPDLQTVSISFDITLPGPGRASAGCGRACTFWRGTRVRAGDLGAVRALFTPKNLSVRALATTMCVYMYVYVCVFGVFSFELCKIWMKNVEFCMIFVFVLCWWWNYFFIGSDSYWWNNLLNINESKDAFHNRKLGWNFFEKFQWIIQLQFPMHLIFRRVEFMKKNAIIAQKIIKSSQISTLALCKSNYNIAIKIKKQFRN